MGSCTNMVSQKNAMIINIAQSRVSNDFSHTILEFPNTSHYQRISPLEFI
ncbi:hypothetical protein BHE74_00034618 [Ensete ventricosum]|nr:hypothetical protein BHE74_00034618 [Ensete ventricosum]